MFVFLRKLKDLFNPRGKRDGESVTCELPPREPCALTITLREDITLPGVSTSSNGVDKRAPMTDSGWNDENSKVKSPDYSIIMLK